MELTKWITENAIIISTITGLFTVTFGVLYKVLNNIQRFNEQLLNRIEHLEKLEKEKEEEITKREEIYNDKEMRHLRIESRFRLEIERLKYENLQCKETYSSLEEKYELLEKKHEEIMKDYKEKYSELKEKYKLLLIDVNK